MLKRPFFLQFFCGYGDCFLVCFPHHIDTHLDANGILCLFEPESLYVVLAVLEFTM